MSAWIKVHAKGVAMMVNVDQLSHVSKTDDGRARIVWQTSSPRAEYILDESFDAIAESTWDAVW